MPDRFIHARHREPVPILLSDASGLPSAFAASPASEDIAAYAGAQGPRRPQGSGVTAVYPTRNRLLPRTTQSCILGRLACFGHQIISSEESFQELILKVEAIPS